MYKQSQLALTIASEEKREKSNCVLSIMELFKKVLLQEVSDTASICSDKSNQSEISDSYSAKMMQIFLTPLLSWDSLLQ